MSTHDGGEDLISIDDVCDDLRERESAELANCLSPIDELNESAISKLNQSFNANNLSTLSDYGFENQELNTSTASTEDGFGNTTTATIGNTTTYGFGPNASVYGFGAETPKQNVSEDRTQRAQQQIADVRRVNQQVKNVGKGTLDANSVDIARTRAGQRQIANVRMVNEQIYNTPHKATVETTGVDFQRAKQGGQFVTDVRIVNEQFRGTGQGSTYGVAAKQLKDESDSQRNVAHYRRVNEQVSGVEAGTMPHDGVEFKRAQTGQKNVADVRIVNEQVRGANAGEQNAYGFDAKQMTDEAKAQREVDTIFRVSEQARGELAGQQTKFDYQARELQRNMTNDAQISNYARVNEQVFDVGVPTMPADSEENSRAKESQTLTFGVRVVNEQVRGELAGQQTSFGVDARLLKAEAKAQQHVASYRRVNEQTRGEFAGKQTHFDSSAQDMVRAKEAPKVQLVNNEVKHVGRGKFNADAFGYQHVRDQQAKLSDGFQERRSNHGQRGNSTYGHGAPEMDRVKNTPKPAFANDNIRGQYAGTPTAFGTQSIMFQQVKTAPRQPSYNEQCRFGSSHGKKADVSAFVTDAEWRPASELPGTLKRPTKKTQEAPATPANNKVEEFTEEIRPACADFFGLRKSTRSKKSAAPPAVTRPQANACPPTPEPNFMQALNKFR